METGIVVKSCGMSRAAAALAWSSKHKSACSMPLLLWARVVPQLTTSVCMDRGLQSGGFQAGGSGCHGHCHLLAFSQLLCHRPLGQCHAQDLQGRCWCRCGLCCKDGGSGSHWPAGCQVRLGPFRVQPMLRKLRLAFGLCRTHIVFQVWVADSAGQLVHVLEQPGCPVITIINKAVSGLVSAASPRQLPLQLTRN